MVQFTPEEKIFRALSRFEASGVKLSAHLAVFARQSKSDALAVRRLQHQLEGLQMQLAIFRQHVLYGYGKPRPKLHLRNQFPNQPEILE